MPVDCSPRQAEVIALPGLSFEGNGRGKSVAAGYVEVFEAVAGADGTSLSFASIRSSHRLARRSPR